MATIEEILRMSLAERKSAYQAKGIEKVTIDGNDFTDYGAFSFLWEKSYVKSPVRSGDGSIGNLNSYATFVTPHLKIDFGLMSIDSYRKLMGLIYSKNEFTVTCYDVVNNKMTTNRMYFSTEEMPKLWTIAHELNGEDWIELAGIQEYTVEMVGTNVALDNINILYYTDEGNLISEATQEVARGEDVLISYDFFAPSGSRFDGEWLTEKGSIVRNGDIIKANTASNDVHDIKLTAKTHPTNQYMLSFDYGNGQTLYNKQNSQGIYEIPFTVGQTIAEAISAANIYLPDGSKFSFPESGTGSTPTTYDGEVYSDPYIFRGWYWNSVGSGSTLSGSTTLNEAKNRTAHQIYRPNKFNVVYHDNSAGKVSFDTIQVAYNEAVPYPRPMLDGKTFIGWYTDEAFKNPFGGTMPPKNLNLYAKWVSK